MMGMPILHHDSTCAIDLGFSARYFLAPCHICGTTICCSGHKTKVMKPKRQGPTLADIIRPKRVEQLRKVK